MEGLQEVIDDIFADPNKLQSVLKPALRTKADPVLARVVSIPEDYRSTMEDDNGIHYHFSVTLTWDNQVPSFWHFDRDKFINLVKNKTGYDMSDYPKAHLNFEFVKDRSDRDRSKMYCTDLGKVSKRVYSVYNPEDNQPSTGHFKIKKI